MMDTALFLFGMKLHRQVGSVEFFDADLANTIQVSGPYLVDKTLGECLLIINETLLQASFTGPRLEVGTLSGIEDFNLANIQVRKGTKISLRFNNFEYALDAFKCLSRAGYNNF